MNRQPPPNVIIASIFAVSSCIVTDGLTAGADVAWLLISMFATMFVFYYCWSRPKCNYDAKTISFNHPLSPAYLINLSESNLCVLFLITIIQVKFVKFSLLLSFYVYPVSNHNYDVIYVSQSLCYLSLIKCPTV